MGVERFFFFFFLVPGEIKQKLEGWRKRRRVLKRMLMWFCVETERKRLGKERGRGAVKQSTQILFEESHWGG